MRGRIKLTGIVVVCLVVALGIGLSLHLADVPADAEVKDGESQAYVEGTGSSIEEAISKAKETVVIQGVVYGVLENGETFGQVSPQYFDEEGNLTEYYPDWLASFTSDDTEGWMYTKDYFAARELDSKNPEEALAMMEERPDPIEIPIYAEPGGGEIIGYTYYQNS